MNKLCAIFLFIIPINLFANEVLTCPSGSTEVVGTRKYEGKDAVIRGCKDSKNKFNGTSLIIVNNQLIDKCNYKNNLKDGTCLEWYVTGEKKASTKYKNDKPHGEMNSWYKNGVMEIQAFHDHGKPIGKWQYWNSNGALVNVIEH